MIMQQDNSVSWNMRLVLLPLCFFIAIVLVGSALNYYLYSEFNSTRVKSEQLENRYRQVQRERRESDLLVKKVDEYQARYNDLRRDGYFHTDAKINWLEKIGEIAQEIGIESVDYTIGSALGESEASVVRSGLHVESIPVTLQLKLLHEVDLLKMLDQVSRKGIGLVSSEGCVIEMSSSEIQLRTLNYAFDASCELKGYVLSFSEKEGV